VKNPPAPLDVEASLIAICRALVTPAEVRSLGTRRKSGTCETELPAARRLTLALAPTNAPEPGRKASDGARSEAQRDAAKAATEILMVGTKSVGCSARTQAESVCGGQALRNTTAVPAAHSWMLNTQHVFVVGTKVIVSLLQIIYCSFHEFWERTISKRF